MAAGNRPGTHRGRRSAQANLRTSNRQPARRASASARWGFVAIAVVAVLTYANSLGHPFLFDDFGTIVRNPQIRNLLNLRQILLPAADTPVAGRPLAHLSFALNYALGGLDVIGYHLGNLALHIICAWLVLALTRRTIDRLPGVSALPWSSSSLAFIVALLWVVHPLNSEVVDYLSQRTESLMAAAYLFTLYASLRALDLPNRRRWVSGSILACAAGALCKETIVTAPLIVALYDRAFVFKSFEEGGRARWPLYLGLMATWIVPGAELLWLQGQTSASGFATAPTSVWTYLLNQAVMVPHYLRLVIWPHPLVGYYGWPLPLRFAEVAPWAIGLAGLVVASIGLFLRSPRWGFVPIWVFVTLAPTSSIIPIATEVGAERRMYLPLAGVVALVVVGLAFGLARETRPTGQRSRPTSPSLAGVARMAVVIVAAVLSTLTVLRNRDYASALTMAENDLERWPSPAAQFQLGTELGTLGRHTEAVTHLEAAVAGDPPARYFLGAELFKVGRLDDAIRTLQTFVHDEPHLPVVRAAHVLIARALELKHAWPDAIVECQSLLSAAPEDADVNGLLADALVAEQSFGPAIPHYRAFLASHPTDPRAWTSLGISFVEVGLPTDAIDAFRHAVAAAPTDSHSRQNLARALLEHGDLEAALDEATQAVAADDHDPAAHDLLGRVRLAQGHPEEARLEFQRALALSPSFPPALEALRHLSVKPPLEPELAPRRRSDSNQRGFEC